MVMPFEKFERIMKTIVSFQDQIHRIDEFFEKEISTETWFICTVGDNLLLTLIRMLADEMNCWFCTRPDHEDANKEWYEVDKYYGKDNEIEEWLYNYGDNERKIMTIDNVDYDVTGLKDFYDYLVEMYLTKKEK